MSIRKEVAQIRTDYHSEPLTLEALADDPIQQFESWFSAAVAAEVLEPNAMSLATIQGRKPTVRIVLLKGFDEQGLVFYTNYESAKGQHIAQNPQVALTFFWPELARQVRIQGTASQLSHAESNIYYQSRDRGSRLGAWASPQSAVIQDRQELETRLAAISKRFEAQESFPKPDFWGGYRVKPDYVEFWQGRMSRLHDRFSYQWIQDQWHIQRLAP